MVVKLLVAGFLVAHAAIHTAFLTPAPPITAGGPAWPFELTRSWVLSPLGVDAGVARAIGTGLVVAVVLAYAVGALAVLGIAPGNALLPAVVLGSAASLVLLVAFFRAWFVIGVGIDAVLIWLAAGNWSPDALGT